MALDFEDTSRMVTVGSAAILDDIEVGTIAAWVRLSGSANSLEAIWCKSVAFTTNGLRAIWVDVTNGDVEFFQDRATADMIVRSSTPLATGLWRFVAVTYNTAGTDSEQHLYWGGTSQRVTEFGYSARTVGSGTVTSDAAELGVIGNQGGGSRQFRGAIAWVGIWRRQLSLDELEDLRRELEILPGCVLFTHLGNESNIGPQLDRSGWNNHGTPSTGVNAPLRYANPDFLMPTKVRRRRRRQVFVQAAGGAPAAPTVRRDNLMLLGVS